MCCGQFKNDLYKQNLVNESLVRMSSYVNDSIDVKKFSKKSAVLRLRTALQREARKTKFLQELVISHGKFDDRKAAIS